MALVVEDGTGLAGANSYISESFADTYHDDRGNTKWAAESSANKQSAIIRATDYIDKRWGVWFRGIKSSSTQALQWPRVNAFDNNGYVWSGVPTLLERACVEYALRALINNVLAPDPSLSVPEQNHVTGSTVTTEVVTGEIQEKMEKVGPITEKTVYRTASENRSQRMNQSSLLEDASIPEYPEADLWMEELTKQAVSMRVARG